MKTRFNPIAAYYRDKEKAYQMSNSAIAYVRDGDWQVAPVPADLFPEATYFEFDEPMNFHLD